MLEHLKLGIVEGATYALIALGYTMVYGILGMINFAHGEIYMIGGYAGIIAVTILASLGVVATSIPLALVLAFLFAMLVCAMYGAALERAAYRPIRNAPVLSPLISAIGASFLLWNYVMLAQGDRGKVFPQAVREELVKSRVADFGGFGVNALEILIFVVAVALMIGLNLFVRRTRTGRAMRATAQDRTMAALVGVPVDRVISTTFVLGSALAATAGVLMSMYTTVMRFDYGSIPGLKAFTAAVLGGIGNIPGAVLGGFLLGIVENLGVELGGADYKHVYSFVLLLLFLVFRPRGLLGERVAEKV